MNVQSIASAHAALPAGAAVPVDQLAERALAAARLLLAQHRVAARPQGAAAASGMAPELTGRTGHAVDERADLYALGATFYEWATGRPPFEERDPLRLVREQLTRAPAAPIALRPDLPQALSDIILRLLEKEPERRYHAAEGLIHDLKRLRAAARRGKPAAFTLGTRDFPPQLSSSQLVGREHENAQLRAAVDAAARGECRVVLVCGAAGVGKSSLVAQLRPLVAERNGRFVAGDFEQAGPSEPSAILAALGALGRLLLTEPDEDLAVQRERILREAGPNAGLVCAVPEFKLLLGDLQVPPPADPAHEAARWDQTILDLLRAIASRERPLVMGLDDLNWSRATTVRLIEGVLGTRDFPGLVLVCAYRDDEQPLPPALALALAGGAGQAGALQVLRIANLGDQQIAQMLARMLRLPERQALPLAQALTPHAGGNPYHTVELVNSLRRDGLLAPRSRDWRWDPAALQRYVSRGEVMDLLEARISRLPPAAREMLQTLSCLGQECSPALAHAALPLPPQEFETQVAVLAGHGLLLRETGPAARLRLLHDRVQQAAYGSMAQGRRVDLHLALARRLAGQGGFETVAADQYVAAAVAVQEPAECRLAAALLRRMAAHARSAANHAGGRRMLEAAMGMLDRAEAAGQGDARLRCACDVDQHLTLFELGQFEEADAIYGRIVERESDPLSLVDAACVQVRSLCNRELMAQAKSLILTFLRDLGREVPVHVTDAELAAGLARLRQWVETFDAAREQARAEAAQPRVIAAAKMFDLLCTPPFALENQALAGWIVTESQALWERHGPAPALAVTLGRPNLVAAALGDRRIGYLAGGHMLAFCEARGWDLEHWQCLYLFAANSIHWYEPVEHSLQQSARAREGLLAGGNLQYACFSYRASIVAVFESAAQLDTVAQEIRAALDIAQRTGNQQAQGLFLPDLQLLHALRGDTAQGASPGGGDFSNAPSPEDNAAMPQAIMNYRLRRGLACAIFGDCAGLCACVGKGLDTGLLDFDSSYPAVWAYWLRGLAAAWLLQDSTLAGDPCEPRQVADLDSSLEWLAGRAADAPLNFRHLHLHLLAERAWALGESIAAAKFFDQALGLVAGLPRPWHRALVTERAGRFQVAQGRPRGGRQLLAQARQLYEAWGASAKAAQLGVAVGLRRSIGGASEGGMGRSGAADDLDTLAVLRASQALSSERSPARLKAKVEEVLGSVTGATQVVLALWDEDVKDWVLREADGMQDGAVVPLSAAAHLVPLTAVRYAERTREPLLLPDAVADDRFGRDAYFQGMERCSLMVVPILHQGMMRAMLVLENRASRGAFSTARLDAVMMIAGQLAVSLESAQLYERLERKVSEQTTQLREAQARLVDEARRAGMAQIATNVLHNVGNVLTSVNVSAHVLAAQVRQSRAARVADLAGLLEKNEADLASFFESDEKGRLLPGYLRELAQALGAEREELLAELGRLGASVDHIKNVVAMQQSYAGASGVLEACSIAALVDDALSIQQAALARHAVSVRRNYAQAPPVPLDKTRVMQILVNLIENARQAMDGMQGEHVLSVSVRQDGGWLSVAVGDSGCGIAHENLGKIFAHGFTTKPDGHGFGLHSCAVAAREMGGSLGVESQGVGKGATFTLLLPQESAEGQPQVARDP